MDFENELTSKILDPIHGTIRLTTLEIAFINHPLFQRLRNIKQNSFLYKVFLCGAQPLRTLSRGAAFIK